MPAAARSRVIAPWNVNCAHFFVVANLTTLSHELDEKKLVCRAIIETPKGSRNKFSYDPESGLFQLKAILPEGMLFPFDFGFIPCTRGGDGDPLDIMVLMDVPAHVGCLIEVRIIGILNATQTENGKTEANHRLLGVTLESYDHEGVRALDDLRPPLLRQIEEFFVTYNRQRGKKFTLKGRGGPGTALKFLKAAIRAFEKQHSV